MGNVVLFTCCEVEFSCHDFAFYCSTRPTKACESFASLDSRMMPMVKQVQIDNASCIQGGNGRGRQLVACSFERTKNKKSNRWT